MSEKNTIVVIAEEVGLAMIPLKDAAQSVDSFRIFMRKLGWDFSIIPTPLSEVVNKLEDVIGVMQAGNLNISNISSLTQKLQQFMSSVKNIASKDDALFPVSIDPVLFKNEFPQQIIQYLLVEYLEHNCPTIFSALKTFGVINLVSQPANGKRPAYIKRDFEFSAIIKVFNDPLSLFKDTYKWNASDFDGALLFDNIDDFLSSIGVDTELNTFSTIYGSLVTNALSLTTLQDYTLQWPLYERGIDGTSAEAGLRLFILPETSSDKPGLSILPYAAGTTELEFNLSENLDLLFNASFDLTLGIAIVIRPGKSIQLLVDLLPSSTNSVPPPAKESIGIGLKYHGVKGKKIILIGTENASRIEFTSVLVEGGARADTSYSNSAFAEFKLTGSKLVIKPGDDADSFINKIFPPEGIEVEFAFNIGIDSEKGVYFPGGAGLEIKLPVHISIGPINIEGVTIALKKEANSIPIELSSTLQGVLGPLSFVVENIGIRTEISFPNSGGNLGPMNMNLGFKPPNGLGLSINAGAVIGGGYLFFDFEKEEYAGALELTIAGFISVKAIGLITTKMPDGRKGFSMLIIITAEFFPPFQLGYGFTLNGVGGLLGLNRTVLLDPLRDGVRTGAVNNIMFPTNVIANAPRIISDLKAIFPAYEGKFLIGPMAKIGWGTPSLITLSFGLIIEIPGNIAILGVLKLILPDEKVPVVKIQVAFVGTIEFDKRMLTFDASLYESNILQTMTLEGDMAVRLTWGNQPNFIMTVGGFHPAYNPPPLALPSLRRLSINILNTSIARIRVECYQAVTSNTVQFGARAELYFDLSACTIDGNIGFDALLQFNPFYFIISASANFKLSAIGIDVMSVRVRLSLEGPTPWKAKGSGSVSVLIGEISADFNKTWGQRKTTSLPPISILPKFREQIEKKENWSTVLSLGKNLSVSLRNLDETDGNGLVLHPAGSLMVLQKLVPLEVEIEKIGNQKTADVKLLKVSASTIDGPLETKAVKENFARAQFQNLSDAQKLSKPSFEKLPGGIEISTGKAKVENGKMVRKKIAYELTVVDRNPELQEGQLFSEWGILFSNLLKGNSVSKSVLSHNFHQKLQPFQQKMDVQEELFTVAYQSNNQAYKNEDTESEATFQSEMEAQSFLQRKILTKPDLKTQLHIIPQFELQEI